MELRTKAKQQRGTGPREQGELLWGFVLTSNLLLGEPSGFPSVRVSKERVEAAHIASCVTQEPAGNSLMHVISERLALLAYTGSQTARYCSVGCTEPNSRYC